ncbi:hypothetical protein DSL72_006909 [Monilinia vaccinii-corymbosi]|uniref:Transcription factor CBF/NF-Y/archaeal histone domain-containing protein n=1 Tax=Monilinia vaccinii-corymbosi TaxID=61207 RepID=A0A8A3PK59_9HELO|nr:hypothetical protein DSL72_006909 [Monilinia vaccinii-corymbosi]
MDSTYTPQSPDLSNFDGSGSKSGSISGDLTESAEYGKSGIGRINPYMSPIIPPIPFYHSSTPPTSSTAAPQFNYPSQPMKLPPPHDNLIISQSNHLHNQQPQPQPQQQQHHPHPHPPHKSIPDPVTMSTRQPRQPRQPRVPSQPANLQNTFDSNPLYDHSMSHHPHPHPHPHALALAPYPAPPLGPPPKNPNPDNIEIRTKFPVARIKRIMQADEEVGKVAQVTPVAVNKALELFMISLVQGAARVAREKGGKRITAGCLKRVVEADEQFDFLSEIVGKVQDTVPASKEEKDRETEREGDVEGSAGATGKKRKVSVAVAARKEEEGAGESDAEMGENREVEVKKRGRGKGKGGRKKKVEGAA